MWKLKCRKAIALLPALLLLSGCGWEEKAELVMFCAAGMKAPVTRIAERYEAETGVAVRLQFGGSGTLLSSLRVAPGDIYLAADSSYIEEAKEYDLVADSLLVAHMRAGFGVAPGNPGGFGSLDDLGRDDVRVAIGNPEAASIGRFTRKILSRHGHWDGFTPTATFPTVNELANAIKLGTVDIVILWDAVANQYPDVDFVSIPEFTDERKDISVAVIRTSNRREEALEFCRYLTDPDRGRLIFGEEGYELPANDSDPNG